MHDSLTHSHNRRRKDGDKPQREKGGEEKGRGVADAPGHPSCLFQSKLSPRAREVTCPATSTW